MGRAGGEGRGGGAEKNGGRGNCSRDILSEKRINFHLKSVKIIKINECSILTLPDCHISVNIGY